MMCNHVFRGLDWKVVFPYVCHEIWKDRNNCVFIKADPYHVQVISYKATSCIRELLHHHGSPILWEPPYCVYSSHEFNLIHVEASFIGPSEAVGMGVLSGS